MIVPTLGETGMDQNKRPSVYLQERCDSVEQALTFFLEAHHGQSTGMDERLVVFLSQLAFWEWEVDNLVYAFTSFAERARAWTHTNSYGLAEALRTRGLLLRPAVVVKLKEKRQARPDRRGGVFAPVARLNQVLARWNQLLDLCEERLLAPVEERQEALRLGAAVEPDLSRWRKEPLPAPAEGA